ncbi:hypothetical protein AOLI_G00223500 [Acnodon oligacanthus]
MLSALAECPARSQTTLHASHTKSGSRSSRLVENESESILPSRRTPTKTSIQTEVGRTLSAVLLFINLSPSRNQISPEAATIYSTMGSRRANSRRD